MGLAKKKRKNLTLILLAVLAIALGVGYVLLSNRETPEDTATPTPAAGELTLCTLPADSITEISFVNPEFEATVRLQEDGSYVLAGREDFPLNQTKAKYIFDYIDTTATSLVMENADLAEYGLAEPQIKITAADNSGASFRLNIGSRVGSASKSGYYACQEGSDTVYLVPATLYTYYVYNEKDLIRIDDAPVIDTTTITSISVESDVYGDFAMYYSSAQSEGASGMALSSWILTSPYAQPLQGDDEAITTLLSNYSGITFTTAEDYREENLEQYGLGASATKLHIEYTVEEETEAYDLYVGNQAENGNYFIRQGDSSLVYRMTESNVKKLVDIDSDSLLNRYVNLIYIRTVSDMSISYGDTTHIYEMLYKTEVNDEGVEEVNSDGFIVDGITLTDTGAFTDLYQVFIAAKANGLLPEDAVYEEEPVLTLIFNRTSDAYLKMQVEYLPYDENNYAVRINGEPVFTIDKRDINSIIEAIDAYSPQ